MGHFGYFPVSLILLHWWMATPTQMPVLLQLSLMGSAVAEKQSQISSGSFQFAAIREMFFIAGWAAASQLLGKQCFWWTWGSALFSWKTSWEEKTNSGSELQWFLLSAQRQQRDVIYFIFWLLSRKIAARILLSRKAIRLSLERTPAQHTCQVREKWVTLLWWDRFPWDLWQKMGF